jgi:hypothetical protein
MHETVAKLSTMLASEIRWSTSPLRSLFPGEPATYREGMPPADWQRAGAHRDALACGGSEGIGRYHEGDLTVEGDLIVEGPLTWVRGGLVVHGNIFAAHKTTLYVEGPVTCRNAIFAKARVGQLTAGLVWPGDLDAESLKADAVFIAYGVTPDVRKKSTAPRLKIGDVPKMTVPADWLNDEGELDGGKVYAYIKSGRSIGTLAAPRAKAVKQAPPTDVSALAQCLAEVETLLTPETKRSLRAPASKDRLRQLAEVCGGQLPSDLLTYFAWHDGQDDPIANNSDAELFPDAPPLYLMPIEEILEAIATNTEEIEDWKPTWVPLITNDGSDYILYDRQTGRLLGWGHEDPDEVYAESPNLFRKMDRLRKLLSKPKKPRKQKR